MPKESTQVPFSFRIDSDLLEKYRSIASDKSVSVGSLVSKACQHYLDELDQTEMTTALICIASRQSKMNDNQKGFLAQIAKDAGVI